MTGQASLARRLSAWFGRHGRDLPWREHRTPYSVWVSEIMLQQTTAAAVRGRYEAFLERFPDLVALARASEEEVLSEVAGLGYYRRFRAMKKAAEQLVGGGRDDLPGTREELLELPGIGFYTSGAICSLAFSQPVPAVDGNVERVLGRLHAMAERVSSRRGLRAFEDRVLELMEHGEPSTITEALFDLGATVCLPRSPRCDACPLQGSCVARQQGRIDEFPTPKVATTMVDRVVVVGHLGSRRGTLFWRRPDDASRMPGFWELPECWADGFDDGVAKLVALVEKRLGARIALDEVTEMNQARHTITRHRLDCRLISLGTSTACRDEDGVLWVRDPSEIPGPVSTITKKLWRRPAAAGEA